jgi:hypothetical protein
MVASGRKEKKAMLYKSKKSSLSSKSARAPHVLYYEGLESVGRAHLHEL